MKTKHLLFSALAVCLVTCCTDTKTDTLQPEPTWETASVGITNPIAPGDTLCYSIELKLDTLTGEGPLAQSLKQVICDSVLRAQTKASVAEVMTAYADSMEAEWKTSMAEMYDAMSEWKETLQYSYKLTGNAIENDVDSILSYQTTLECYLGGAHGSYVIMYYNFDRKTGKLLHINDLVPADKQQDVLRAMEEQLCKDWEAKDLADLQEKTGITMLGDLYLTNNFLLKNDSILFLFNQYEIAPYAAGLISVTVKRP